RQTRTCTRRRWLTWGTSRTMRSTWRRVRSHPRIVATARCTISHPTGDPTATETEAVVAGGDERLPEWVTWQQRPFPDANLLLLHGRGPVMVDSGFVGHAEDTAQWARARAGHVALVVNTHWHADHVGGNGLLQAMGAGIAASRPDAQAVARRDPGCCVAEYLDQPVAPYTVDQPLDDGQIVRLGDADWQVIRTPGHTPGHLSLWQPDERLLAVVDALSDYDVGWVNLALERPEDAAAAVASPH